jgi:hypothetical protein
MITPAPGNRVRFIFVFVSLVFAISSQAQGYVSPWKFENGKQEPKSRSEILAEEVQRSSRNSYSSFPREYDKPKNGIKPNGEIWIDGYCRFRPPAYNRCRYNEEVSEIEFCRERYPSDTLMQTDDFSGNGTLPWVENTYEQTRRNNIRELLKRVVNSSEGLPFPVYDSIQRISNYSSYGAGKWTGRDYEFSRAVSIWVKRVSGPESMSIKFTTGYLFSNSEDYTDVEVNDDGKYKVSRFFDNGKSPMYKELESGKLKAWRSGEWNEIAVKKDEFNTVAVYLNGEEVCRYQLASLPIAARFSRFSLSMPSQWEKKKLLYQVGRVTSIAYPRMQ